MNIVCLDGIGFRRGSRSILADVSWTVQRGQHWALLGANGSGKTTLLKIITGYEWPSEGSVEALGEPYGECDLPTLRKRIGWVSSAMEIFMPEHDTAIEVVLSGLESSFGLFRQFDGNEQARALRALELIRASDIADQPNHLLSQGERQRMLIARAMVNDPALLILDEPCAGLDPGARDAFLCDLGRLADHEDSPTMILVTHHIEEIGPWIDHVLAIKSGRTVTAGSRSDVLTGEVLSDVFDFPCTVERQNGLYHLRPSNGRV